MIVEKKTASNILHWAIFDLKMGAQSGGHPGAENRPDHHSSLQNGPKPTKARLLWSPSPKMDLSGWYLGAHRSLGLGHLFCKTWPTQP